MSIAKTMADIGLSDNEIKLYLACLAHGPESIANLTNLSGIKRSTVAYTLNQMTDRGFVSTLKSGKRVIYDAESPQNLAKLLKERESKLQTILPELKAMRQKEIPTATTTVYEGRAGLKKMYRQIYQAVDRLEPVDFLTSIRDIKQYAPFALEEFIQTIARRKDYKIRELIFDDPTDRQYLKELEAKKVKHPRKLLPPDYPVYNDLIIFGSSVALISFKKRLSAIVIDNPDIALTIKTMYNWAWQNGLDA